MNDLADVTESLARGEVVHIGSANDLAALIQQTNPDTLTKLLQLVAQDYTGEGKIINNFFTYLSIYNLTSPDKQAKIAEYLEGSAMCFRDMPTHLVTYFQLLNNNNPEMAQKFINHVDFKRILQNDKKALVNIVISLDKEELTDALRETIFKKLYDACVAEDLSCITAKPHNIIKKLSKASVKVFCETFSEFFLSSDTENEAPINIQKLITIIRHLNQDTAEALITGLNKNLQAWFAVDLAGNVFKLFNIIEEESTRVLFFKVFKPYINQINDFNSLYILLSNLSEELRSEVVDELGEEKIKALVENIKDAQLLLSLSSTKIGNIAFPLFCNMLEAHAVRYKNIDLASISDKETEAIAWLREIVWKSLEFSNEKQRIFFIERHLTNCKHLIFKDMVHRGKFLEHIVPASLRDTYIEILFKNSGDFEGVSIFQFSWFAEYLKDEELQTFVNYQQSRISSAIADNSNSCWGWKDIETALFMRLPFEPAIKFINAAGLDLWCLCLESEYLSRFMNTLNEDELLEFLAPFIRKENYNWCINLKYRFTRFVPAITTLSPERINALFSKIHNEFLGYITIQDFARISGAIKDAPENIQLSIISRLDKLVKRNVDFFSQFSNICEIIGNFQSEAVLTEISKNLPYRYCIEESLFDLIKAREHLANFNTEQFACLLNRMSSKSVLSFFDNDESFSRELTADKLSLIAKKMLSYRNFKKTNLRNIFTAISEGEHEKLLEEFAPFIKNKFSSSTDIVEFLDILSDTAKRKLCELKNDYIQEQIYGSDKFRKLLECLDAQSQLKAKNFSFFVVKQAAQIIINDFNKHAERLSRSADYKGYKALPANSEASLISTLAVKLQECLDKYSYGQDLDADRINRRNFAREWSTLLNSQDYAPIAKCNHAGQTHSKAKNVLIAVATVGIAMASRSFRQGFFTPKTTHMAAKRLVGDCGYTTDEQIATALKPVYSPAM